MTMPSERINSLRNTKEFLVRLLNPKETPRVPKKIRKDAYWCLRHFPWECNIETCEKKCKCGVFK